MYEVNLHEVGWKKSMEKFYWTHSSCRPIPYCPTRSLIVWVWFLYLLYEEKLSVIYIYSPTNKQIFVGIVSNWLILDVILQKNYRWTILNGGTIRHGLPISYRPSIPYCPTNKLCKWINMNSACVVWSKSTRSWVQEDMEKVYGTHSRCRPIPYCPKRYLATARLDMTFASVVWRKTIRSVHE